MILPAFIAPTLATLVDRAPGGDAWLHEIKFDGYRTAIRLSSGSPRMFTRTGLDWTARFKPIAAAASKLKAKTAYIDGEVAVLDDAGVSDFGGLQEALSEGKAERLIYFAFDLLHLDGKDLTGLRLTERKTALARLLGRPSGPIRLSEHIEGHGESFSSSACKTGLEGIVSPPPSFKGSAGRQARAPSEGGALIPGVGLGSGRLDIAPDRMDKMGVLAPVACSCPPTRP